MKLVKSDFAKEILPLLPLIAGTFGQILQSVVYFYQILHTCMHYTHTYTHTHIYMIIFKVQHYIYIYIYSMLNLNCSQVYKDYSKSPKFYSDRRVIAEDFCFSSKLPPLMKIEKLIQISVLICVQVRPIQNERCATNIESG